MRLLACRACACWLILSSTAGILTAQQDSAPASAVKEVVLFDGRSFEGWEGNLSMFRIEDGAIVGGSLKKPIPRNEFLCTKRQYANFELRLKFKLFGEGVNAGVQIRSKRVPNHHEVSGYQADLADGHWGALYDESRRGSLVKAPPPEEVARFLKPDDWNRYVIRCEKDRIELWINGHKTVDYTEKDPAIPRRGIIGLQIHGGPPSEAWYRDIVIREL